MKSKLLAVLLLVCMFALVGTAYADHDGRWVREEAARRQMTLITINQAREIASKSFASGNVRIKEIELENEADDYPNDIHFRPTYQFELVHNGIEYDVDIDAATGEVLKLKRDD